MQVVDISKRIGTQHHEIRDTTFSEESSGVLLADGSRANYCRGTQGINRCHTDIAYQAFDFSQ
jgi:hypothetical protein